jgi:hypothetical protein
MEELKKEWRDELKECLKDSIKWRSSILEGDEVNTSFDINDDKILSFISSLLAKKDDCILGLEVALEGQQIMIKSLVKQQDTPMGYSQWLAHGKKFGYKDYLQEEFVKCLPEEKDYTRDLILSSEYASGYNACIADIKSKLNI